MLTVYTGLENQLLIRSKTEICIKQNIIIKKKNTKIKYANDFFQTWGWVILQHVFINLSTTKMTMMTQR